MSKEKASIAVLFAAYNGQNYVVEQIESIINQSEVEVAIFVSDDNSNDKTLDLLCRLVQLYSNITLLEPVSYGSACQNFFRLLNDVDFNGFDFVALSDQDDKWLPDKLSSAIQSINQKRVDAYSSNVTAFWSNGKSKLIPKAQPQQGYDYMFESAGPGCTFVITKQLALEIQRFLKSHKDSCKQVALHDWFIYAFARSRGYKWYIDPVPHMQYRQHSGNVVGANFGFKAKLVRWKKMREGWFVGQVVLLADLLGYADDWPIQKLRRYQFFDRLTLIAKVHKLRRRWRDRIALVLFLLLPLKK